ncbi:hypothetical protein Taro_010791, partial [Colocasia esculenta]|nr:hypothetical protein [Colocasia esculenta]
LPPPFDALVISPRHRPPRRLAAPGKQSCRGTPQIRRPPAHRPVHSALPGPGDPAVYREGPPVRPLPAILLTNLGALQTRRRRRLLCANLLGKDSSFLLDSRSLLSHSFQYRRQESMVYMENLRNKKLQTLVEAALREKKSTAALPPLRKKTLLHSAEEGEKKRKVAGKNGSLLPPCAAARADELLPCCSGCHSVPASAVLLQCTKEKPKKAPSQMTHSSPTPFTPPVSSKSCCTFCESIRHRSHAKLSAIAEGFLLPSQKDSSGHRSFIVSIDPSHSCQGVKAAKA